MAEYRRRKGSDTWHWCTNCSNWPKGRAGKDFVVKHTRPRAGELDNQCLAKERKGTCKTKS